MSLEIYTRAAKRAYKERHLQDTGSQFFNRIFGIEDRDTTANFLVDKLISTPYATSYTDRDGESHVRKFDPGTGYLYEVPISKEKTPVSGRLRDSIQVGSDASSGFGENEIKLTEDIVMQHVEAINMMKNWQAMQVFVDGKFYAYGPTGDTIGLDINFRRAAGNSTTYDFTAGAATVAAALQTAGALMDASGTPHSNRCVLMGQNWLNEYATDSDIADQQQNNPSAVIAAANMTPPQLLGIDGLYVVGQYRPPQSVSPFWILSYAPSVPYKATESGSAGNYIGDNDAVFFSLDDRRWKVTRGVDAFDDNGSVIRVASDIVFDTFNENDPIVKNLRSQSRQLFVPGNVDHTVKITGTFS